MLKKLTISLIGLVLLYSSILIAQDGAAEATTSISKWSLPDSPTGRASASYLEAVKREDPEYTKNFIDTKFSPSLRDAMTMEGHLGMFRRMYNDLAQPELISAQKTNSYSCILIIRSQKKNQRFSATLKIEETEPYRITSISVEPYRAFEIINKDEAASDSQVVGDDTRLTDITHFDQMLEAFHKDKGNVRLITLLSPT